MAAPLLKWIDGEPSLRPEGLQLLQSLEALSVIVFLGDGRAGKSYLANKQVSALGGPADPFRAASQQMPVTEGIDLIAVPHHGQNVVIMDCEGGNDAQGPIRTMVYVLGMLSAQQVVYVVAGQAGEAQLQTLGGAVAARQLLKHGSEGALPAALLQFVVNKKDPTLDAQDLEELLREQHDGPRNELRATIKAGFGARQLYNIPLSALTHFEADWGVLRDALRANAAPLQISGATVSGVALASMLRTAFEQMRRDGEVRVPSMVRLVVFDGFLKPLAEQLLQQYMQQLPNPVAYQPLLQDRRNDVIANFQNQTAHLREAGLVAEALQWLQGQIDQHWVTISAQNEDIGRQTQDTTTETQEVFTHSYEECVGEGERKFVVAGPRKKFWVTRNVYNIQSRTRLLLKNGSVEYSVWTNTGSTTTK